MYSSHWVAGRANSLASDQQGAEMPLSRQRSGGFATAAEVQANNQCEVQANNQCWLTALHPPLPSSSHPGAQEVQLHWSAAFTAQCVPSMEHCVRQLGGQQKQVGMLAGSVADLGCTADSAWQKQSSHGMHVPTRVGSTEQPSLQSTQAPDGAAHRARAVGGGAKVLIASCAGAVRG